MKKIKLGVIFGGMSTENEVSCISALSVIKNLNKEKYEIYSIYIDRNGKWFKIFNIEEKKLEEKEEIGNIVEFLKSLDTVFPVLHGLYGEDGTIQGMLELLRLPYVGCRVLASSVGMDKVYTKIVFEKAGIKQTKHVYIKTNEDKYTYVDEQFNEQVFQISDLSEMISRKLKFPMFVKPSNCGSSLGINKVNNKLQLEEAIEEASKFDRKILVEEGIVGKEVECAILESDRIIASSVGEIRAADEFYSYDAKYNNQESKTLIPAEISPEKSKKIQELAIKAFKAIDGKGLSRVDFFVEQETEEIYINEINTLPGFTSISMYAQLLQHDGIEYSVILDMLIQNSLKNKNAIKNP